MNTNISKTENNSTLYSRHNTRPAISTNSHLDKLDKRHGAKILTQSFPSQPNDRWFPHNPQANRTEICDRRQEKEAVCRAGDLFGKPHQLIQNRIDHMPGHLQALQNRFTTLPNCEQKKVVKTILQASQRNPLPGAPSFRLLGQGNTWNFPASGSGVFEKAHTIYGGTTRLAPKP